MLEPVAMIRVSKSMTRPLAQVTVLANLSIDSALSPTCRVIAVLAVPGHRVEHQIVVVDVGLAREDVREHDAVVIAVRFVADHRDVEAVPAARQDLLDRPGTGHTVAHHHEFHQNTTMPKSMTTGLMPRRVRRGQVRG